MKAIIFLLGLVIGAIIQRFVIYLAIRNISPTICDYCKWKKQNEWRWEKWKSRHKRGDSI